MYIDVYIYNTRQRPIGLRGVRRGERAAMGRKGGGQWCANAGGATPDRPGAVGPGGWCVCFFVESRRRAAAGARGGLCASPGAVRRRPLLLYIARGWLRPGRFEGPWVDGAGRDGEWSVRYADGTKYALLHRVATAGRQVATSGPTGCNGRTACASWRSKSRSDAAPTAACGSSDADATGAGPCRPGKQMAGCSVPAQMWTG